MPCSLLTSIYKTAFSLLKLLVFSSWLLAQSAQPTFFNYTADNGLPSSECYEIIQDQKGYIWVSTDNGVSRFNGSEFKNYGTREGLLDKTVLFMHEDHRGWIWMSTLSGNFYIHRGDTIVPYEFNTVFQDIRQEFNLALDFIVDKEGNLHVSLIDYGIIKITPGGEVIKWTPKKARSNYGVYEIEEGYLQYIHNNIESPIKNEIFLHFKSTLRNKYRKQSAQLINDLRKIGLKNPGFFPLGGQYFLNIGEQNIFFDQAFNSQAVKPFPHGLINCLIESSSGVIFTGLFIGNGIKIFANKEDFRQGILSQTLLENHTVSHLYEDQRGGLWAATIEQGIYYFPSLSNQYIKQELEDDQYAAIASTYPHHEDVYIGTRHGRVFNFTRQQFERELPNAGNENQELRFLSYNHEAQTLIKSVPGEVYKNQRWHYLSYNNRLTTLSGAVEGLEDHIIACHTNYSILQLSNPNDENDFHTEAILFPLLKNINCAASRDLTNLWIGTRTGLYHYIAEKDTSLVMIDDSLLLNQQVNFLQLLPDESLLIATKRKGLLHLKDGKVIRPSFNDQLDANPINKIRIDYLGNIWAVSRQGIHKIRYQSDTLHQVFLLSTLNGLPSNEILDVAFRKDQLWAIDKDEISIFPLAIDTQQFSLKVTIEDIFLNEKKAIPSALEGLSQNNSIKVEFSARNFAAYLPTRYRYRLSSDYPWVETTDASINFVDLAPNDYQLEIQALQNNYQWSTSTLLSILIIPPFWQTSAFIILCVCLGLAIIYWLFRRRLNLLVKEQERLTLQEQVTQLKQKAYRAQMNPHFIFNCMNTIQGMIIGEKEEKGQAIKMLASFSQLIRTALEFSEAETLNLTEEINLLKNYLSLEQIRFNHDFTYRIQLAPDIEPDWVKIPPMLIQPFVENAVLHGMENKQGDGEIKINYSIQNEVLIVNICDNGPGISHTKAEKAKQNSKYQHKSLGMTITQRRLEILNDAQYVVKVDEPQNEKGQVIGTTVTVHIPLDNTVPS